MASSQAKLFTFVQYFKHEKPWLTKFPDPEKKVVNTSIAK